MFRINYLFLFAFLFFAISCKKNSPTNKTLTLQPANNTYDYHLVFYNNQDASGTGFVDIPVETWTIQSTPITVRELMKFDLTTIPPNATIQSATFSLYSDTLPQNGNLIDANYGTTDALWIQQVTSDWSPSASSTNWSNQPSVLTNNQISIDTTSTPFLNLNIDVTSMVSDMVKNNTNYGFLIRLQNEQTYNSRIFCSSYSQYASRRPMLEVKYTISN